MAAQPTTATLTQNVFALDKLLADVKARIGVFLANEKTIYGARSRLDALATVAVPAIRANVEALRAKADALLKIQKDAETQAQALIGRAGELRNQMETNPSYAFLKDASPKYWGLRQYELLGNLIMDVTRLMPEGTNLSIRLLNQNSDVKKFMSEVASTEQAAAGTGWAPKISALVSSTVGTAAEGASKALWPLAIGALMIGAVYFSVTSGGFMRGRK